MITGSADVPKTSNVHQNFVHVFAGEVRRHHLLQDIGEFIVLRSGDLGVNTKVTNLVVGWGMTTVSFDSLDDGVEIVECSIPSLALSSHPNAEITSRPRSVWVL